MDFIVAQAELSKSMESKKVLRGKKREVIEVVNCNFQNVTHMQSSSGVQNIHFGGKIEI